VTKRENCAENDNNFYNLVHSVQSFSPVILPLVSTKGLEVRPEWLGLSFRIRDVNPNSSLFSNPDHTTFTLRDSPNVVLKLVLQPLP
jgi:hypothetical protein